MFNCHIRLKEGVPLDSKDIPVEKIEKHELGYEIFPKYPEGFQVERRIPVKSFILNREDFIILTTEDSYFLKKDTPTRDKSEDPNDRLRSYTNFFLGFLQKHSLTLNESKTLQGTIMKYPLDYIKEICNKTKDQWYKKSTARHPHSINYYKPIIEQHWESRKVDQVTDKINKHLNCTKCSGTGLIYSPEKQSMIKCICI